MRSASSVAARPLPVSCADHADQRDARADGLEEQAGSGGVGGSGLDADGAGVVAQ
ncbi:hypothetical protein [Nocardia sp. CA-135398]|uniref:hypothetical protein n=1 Tax=Nocardia sp. CA-135398 TaxID=3239977 RepID=UPI003D95F148